MSSNDVRQSHLPEGQELAIHLLRGLASQAVLVGHAIAFYSTLKFLQPPVIPYIQAVGVIVFFFISGIVITHALVWKSTSQTYTFGSYFLERFARIEVALIPALFLVLLNDSILRAAGVYAENLEEAFSLTTFLLSCFNLQEYPTLHYFGGEFNLLGVQVPSFGSARPLWTVAIESWLYVFFGYLFFLLTRRRFPGLIASLLFAVSLPIAFHHTVGGIAKGLALIWFVGSFAYFVLSRKEIEKCGALVPATLFAASIVVFAFTQFHMILAPNSYAFYSSFIIAFSCFSFVFLMGQPVFTRFWRAAGPAARFLASYSYSLYLVHYSILTLLRGLLPELDGFFGMIVAVILCNGVAYLLYLACERHHRKVRGWLQQMLLSRKSPTLGAT